MLLQRAPRFLLLVTGLLGLSPGFAKVRLPGLFSDNMVLQQQTRTTVWGTATANTTVSVVTSWNHWRQVVRSDATGNWKISLATPSAGGPYHVVISDGTPLTLKNVMIGEVWLCSGQSNMEMPLRGNSSPVLNASEIILDADNPSLRLYTVSRATSLTPVADTRSAWRVSTSAAARDFSAIAFQYGQILQRKLHVPVGVIVSSVGGTMIEAWMSAESLRPFPEVVIPPSLDTIQAPHKQPTALFNGMIAPLTGFAIKGFVWFQGESNRHEPERYGRLFPAMIADWRMRWHAGNLPFYYVQIAPFGSKDNMRNGMKLREAQLKAMDVVANSGMVPAVDVGMENDVHFMDKTTLARRLSYWALGNTYGIKGINYRFPVLRSWAVDGANAVLTFDNAPYLTSYRKPLTLFEVAGDDRKFYPATADIKANQVTLQCPQVSKPVAVRYAWREWFVGELYNNDGLPASSFRTDDW